MVEQRKLLPSVRLRDMISYEEFARLTGVAKVIRAERGPGCFEPTNLNTSARAGPALESFGISRKGEAAGMFDTLCREIIGHYIRTPKDRWPAFSLLANVGCRTKLRDFDKAKAKVEDGKAFARAVAMVDMIEQHIMTPMTRPLGKYFKERCADPGCSFKQKLQRSSTAWDDLGRALHAFPFTNESDHPAFDLHQPNDDIDYAVGFLFWLFDAEDADEQLFLDILKKIAIDSYTEHLFVDDEGNVTEYDEEVKSGISLTSDIGSVIRLMKDIIVYRTMGYGTNEFMTYAAGDDAIAGLTRVVQDFPEVFAGTSNRLFDTQLDSAEVKVFPKSAFLVNRVQPIFEGLTCLNSTSDLRGQETGHRVANDDLVIDHSVGLTHRNFYAVGGAPSFLKFHWRYDFKPIRSAGDVLLRKLHPEGTISSLREDIVANMGMIIDNPFNVNAVNQAFHRIIVGLQVTLLSGLEMSVTNVLHHCETPKDDRFGIQFFPEVAFFRRAGEWTDPGDSFVDDMFSNLNEFLGMARTLYYRRPEGGIDAWRLKEILRLDRKTDRSMWGNDFSGMIDYVLSCPLGRALGLRKSDFGGLREAAVTPQTHARFESYAEDLMNRLRRDQLKDKGYALSVGERKSELAKAGHAAKGHKLSGGKRLYQGP
jgi:hypothetical protein